MSNKKTVIIVSTVVIILTLSTLGLLYLKHLKTMKITVTRENFGDIFTTGTMSIDGNFFCYTLEDKVRPVKIKGETAIPEGTYKVIIDYSDHFMKPMPHILDVPNFDGIRINNGNTDKDTEGCILLGSTRNGDFISNSVPTFNNFMNLITPFLKGGGEIYITIKNKAINS